MEGPKPEGPNDMNGNDALSQKLIDSLPGHVEEAVKRSLSVSEARLYPAMAKVVEESLKDGELHTWGLFLDFLAHAEKSNAKKRAKLAARCEFLSEKLRDKGFSVPLVATYLGKVEGEDGAPNAFEPLYAHVRAIKALDAVSVSSVALT